MATEGSWIRRAWSWFWKEAATALGLDLLVIGARDAIKDHAKKRVGEYLTKVPRRDKFNYLVFVMMDKQQNKNLRARLKAARAKHREDEMITLLCKLLFGEETQPPEKNQAGYIQATATEEERWLKTLKAINDLDKEDFEQLIYGLKHDRIQQFLHRLGDIIVETGEDAGKRIDTWASTTAAPAVSRLADWLESLPGATRGGRI